MSFHISSPLCRNSLQIPKELIRIRIMFDDIDFISANYELAGFYPGNSFAQTVKELIDNSIDAAKQNFSVLNIQSWIAVNLEADPLRYLIDITVSDNGCGMTDPVKCFGHFQSNSNSEDLCRIGKYGLGLTAASMVAQKLTEHSTLVKTKTISEKLARNYEAVYDQNESKIVIRELGALSSLDEFPISGTSVGIKHPINATTLTGKRKDRSHSVIDYD